jgi:hypothetical protein
MRRVLGAQHFSVEFGSIPLVYLLDVHHRKKIVSLVAQPDRPTLFNAAVNINVQGNGNGKDMSFDQAHVVEDALIVFAAEESADRRESAAREQLKIADRPFRKP